MPSASITGPLVMGLPAAKVHLTSGAVGPTSGLRPVFWASPLNWAQAALGCGPAGSGRNGRRAGDAGEDNSQRDGGAGPSRDVAYTRHWHHL